MRIEGAESQKEQALSSIVEKLFDFQGAFSIVYITGVASVARHLGGRGWPVRPGGS